MSKNQSPSTFCLLGAAVLFVGAAAPSRAALIANWTFDSDLTDAVGSKDATGFGGANFQTTTSKIGAGSALFDGANDYMTAGTTSDFAIGTGTMSVSFWFRVTTPGVSDRFIATGAGNNTQAGWTVFLDTTSPDRIGPGMSDGTGRTIQKGNANGAVDAGDGGWHLAVGVFNATTATVSTYLDSVLESTIATEVINGGADGGTVNNSFQLNFGKLPGGSLNYLDGYLDDVAIWDAALSQSQIDALWNGGAGQPAASLGGTGTTFAGWIGGFGLDASDQDFEDDPDGDGLENGVEALFGTDPGVANTGLTALSVGTNTLSFQHPNPDTPLNDVTGDYEWSLHLVTWYADDGLEGDGSTTVTTVATPDDPVDTTTTVTCTMAGTIPDQLFLRAVATTP